MFQRTHAGPSGSRPLDEERQPAHEIQEQVEQAVARPLVETAPALNLPHKKIKLKRKKKKGKPDSVWIRIDPARLPSNNMLYPHGVVIKYRPYDFVEIDTFSQAAPSLTQLDSLRMMSKGIIVKGMDKNDVSFSDMLFLFMLRKLSSLGGVEFRVSFMYEGNKHSTIIRANDIEFIDLELPALPICVEIWDRTVEFRPLTFGQYLELLERFGTLTGSKATVYLMAAQSNLPFKEAVDLISRATAEDYATLKTIELMLYHGVKDVEVPIKEMVVNLEHNPEDPNSRSHVEVVKDVITVGLDDPAVMVEPFRRSGDTGGNRIYFGTK